MLRALLISFTLLAATPVHAGEYPTDPDEKDELCQDLWKGAASGISPKDAVWYQANCRCVETVRCGHPGSPRFKAAVEADRKAREKAEANRRAAEESEAVASCRAYVGCVKGPAGAPGACDAAWARLEYRCSAAWRDLEACHDFIAAATRAPGEARCETLREEDAP